MIRVTVELVPMGDEAYTRPLGTLEIGNVGDAEPGADGDCRYECRLQAGNSSVWETRHVSHYRADGWEPLVARAIEAFDPRLAARCVQSCDDESPLREHAGLFRAAGGVCS